MGLYNLDKVFEPESVAVIGASEKKGSIGSALVENLINAGYTGDIYPVNPEHKKIHGYKALKSVSDAEKNIDLAIIAVPIRLVPDIITDCVSADVKSAIIISAGGRETGEKGREIEEKIQKNAQKGGLRIIGPNCMGIIFPHNKLNASFGAAMPPDGSMAFISQSGAICSSMLDLSFRENMGYRYFISVGSMLDVDFADLIDYVAGDPEVKSILLYIEGLNNFRKFMSASRAASRTKPIIVLKSGRSDIGTRAASSHTGAIAGDDRIYDAAFKRAGAVRVYTLDEFFNCSELLSKKSVPKGPRMMILTNSGGPGVMAADAIETFDLKPAALSDESVDALEQLLPSHWSRGNPVDILGEADAQRYKKAVQCLKPNDMDGLLVILNPQAMTEPDKTARAMAEVAKEKPCPLFASWMGGEKVAKGIEILNQAGIPTYDTPEEAIRAFHYLYEYSKNLKILQEIPPAMSFEFHFDRDCVGRLIEKGLSRKHARLTEPESKQVLSAYGIPVNRTAFAASKEDAQDLAEKLGYPLVMKISSPDIIHKSDVGGVKLNLQSAADIAPAFESITQKIHKNKPDAEIHGVSLQTMHQRPEFEIIAGAKNDRNFGPVITFGLGGIYTELFKDINLDLVPLNRLLARRLMQGTRTYTLLSGYRGQPAADIKAFEEMLVCLSNLVIDFPEISELDMNPVIVADSQPLVLDARIGLRPVDVASPHHLSISPYPRQFEWKDIRTDGLRLFIRPIKPEDGPLLEDLFDRLSATSIYHRFFSPLKTLPHYMLVRFTQIDYEREISLVALEENDAMHMIGVSRVTANPDGTVGEFAVLVGDDWQGKGIGAQLLKRCLYIAKERGMEKVWGSAMTDNTQMVALAKKLGFDVALDAANHEYQLTIDLTGFDSADAFAS